MNAADVLRAAADRIERHGHCQGYSERDGRCCVLGALDRTTNDSALHDRAVKLLSAHLGMAGHHLRNVVAWNDAPGRTAAEVIAALRGAAGGAS